MSKRTARGGFLSKKYLAVIARQRGFCSLESMEILLHAPASYRDTWLHVLDKEADDYV